MSRIPGYHIRILVATVTMSVVAMAGLAFLYNNSKLMNEIPYDNHDSKPSNTTVSEGVTILYPADYRYTDGDAVVVIDIGNASEYKSESSFEMLRGVAVQAQKLSSDGISVVCISRGTAGSDEMNHFLNENECCMYIALKASSGEATTAYYNDTYFIPGLNSVTLADTLEKNELAALGGHGKLVRTDDELILNMTVPAAAVTIGNEGAFDSMEEYTRYAADALNESIDTALNTLRL